jgi:hypothetical protein
MGGLMRFGGFARGRAATWVAVRLSAAGYADINANTVKGWRKEALEAPKEFGGDRYAVGIERPDWSEPEIRAEQLMANLIVRFPPQAVKR